MPRDTLRFLTLTESTRHDEPHPDPVDSYRVHGYPVDVHTHYDGEGQSAFIHVPADHPIASLQEPGHTFEGDRHVVIHSVEPGRRNHRVAVGIHLPYRNRGPHRLSPAVGLEDHVQNTAKFLRDAEEDPAHLVKHFRRRGDSPEDVLAYHAELKAGGHFGPAADPSGVQAEIDEFDPRGALNRDRKARDDFYGDR